MFSRCRPREAVETYVGDKHIEHNPRVEDGKEAFIEYFERMAKEYPDKKTHFVRTIAEDDYVVLHCHQEWPGSDDYVGIDFFRFGQVRAVLSRCQGELKTTWLSTL